MLFPISRQTYSTVLFDYTLYFIIISSLSNRRLNVFFFSGVKIDLPGVGITTVRVAFHSAIFDTPARSMFMNFKSFSGYYGCCACTTKGQQTPNLKGTSTHTYPFCTDNPETGHAPYRTDRETEEHGTEAERTEKEQMGVKGISWLSKMPGFSMIRGCPIDYMHSVCIGVVPYIMNIWFNPIYKNKDYYLGDKVKDIDKRLSSINPPSLIHRIPNSVSKLGDWKASEFKVFLLYFSAAVLFDFLPSIHYKHWMYLVNGIGILISNSFTKNDLGDANILLRNFCATFSILYHQGFETYNVHSVLHLCKNAQDLGPLWANSCFFYEDLNGDIRHMFHGSRNIGMQILQIVKLHNTLPRLSQYISEGVNYRFYSRMNGNRTLIQGTKTFPIGNHIYGNDKLRHYELPHDLYSELVRCTGFKIQNVKSFRKVRVNGINICSTTYTRMTKRANYVVCYLDTVTNICQYGTVQNFLQCQLEDPKEFKYIAILKVRSLYNMDTRAKHIAAVNKERDDDPTVCVCLTDILEVCVLVKHDTCDMIARFRNSIEKE